jgi:putative aldouronate transport system substrate-binding protein
MKKLVTIMLVFFTASVVLFAGARKDAAQSANDVRLKMLAVWNGGYKVPQDQYNNPVAKAIRDKIGVTVEIEGIMMNETEKLNLMFASGDMPDIVNAAFWGGSTGESGVIKKAASQGMLLPIDAMLAKYPNVKRALDIGVISQKYLEADLQDPLFGGKQYLIPQETPGNVNHITVWTYGVFVRGDVPKALGIDEKSIKTPDQLYDFMVKAKNYGFKDVNGNPTIVATTRHNGWAYDQYSEGFSTQKLTTYVRNADGSVTADALTPAWIDRNLFIWKMVNQGILDKECFTITDTLADQKIGNGTALFFAAHYNNGIDATKLTGLYNSHPEMRFIPVGPMNDITGQPLIQVESEGRTGTPVIFFPSTCKDLDAAFRYIDYLNTPEGITLAMYGFEGQTFVRNSSGQPRFAPEYLKRLQASDPTLMDELRDKFGMDYAFHRLWYGDLKKDWFGESGLGAADAAVPEMEAYRLRRPAKIYPGYAVSAFESEYPEIDRVRIISDADREKTYRERAYFANTEAEARQILVSWQDYLKTPDSGLYLKFLDVLAQKARTRSDIAF